jgi:hypothetical protein
MNMVERVDKVPPNIQSFLFRILAQPHTPNRAQNQISGKVLFTTVLIISI